MAKSALLWAVVALWVLAPAARGGTGLVVGIDDDSLKWTGNTPRVVAEQHALGVRTVRVTLAWVPGPRTSTRSASSTCTGSAGRSSSETA